MLDVAEELARLILEIKSRVPVPRPDYTKGYLDALVYVLEWVEENEA